MKRWSILPFSLPDPWFAALRNLASAEGFEFLDRLETAWRDGGNRFDRPGETLLAAIDDADGLIAIGGLNLDPYGGPHDCARLRHVYVQSSWRRSGVGRALVEALLDHARVSQFTSVRLRTMTAEGAAFYTRLGFHRVDESHATHAIALR